MKVCVYTLGCKVNECEGRSIMEELEEYGFDVTGEIVSDADYFVLNTCSVTAEADRKCRQTLGKMISAAPSAKILVCGCSSQYNRDFYEKHENVVFVTGSGSKNRIAEVLTSKADISGNEVGEVSGCYEYMMIPKHYSTRDFIKIQDGCNNFCSYCLIPYVRGRERSRKPEDILEEMEIASKRTGEIVLTGINLSSYGKDINSDLPSLCRLLSEFNVRKRMGSLECGIVNENLLKAMKESGFCDHFHLSLQSGSDDVLKAMNRHYTTDEYLKKVELIRKYFPNAGITTDIITGFPTETEDNFAETCDFVKKAKFSDIHIFPYSERKGTRAYNLKQVEKNIRKERAISLGQIRDELKNDFLKRQIGKELDVYFETADNGVSEGYASNYVRVYSETALPGAISRVRISGLFKKGVK